MTGANLLTAIFSEEDSHAASLLGQQAMTRVDAVNFIARGIRKGDRAAYASKRTSAASPLGSNAVLRPRTES